ncbi:unnamed protein product, partial [Phaeothamnion confervicola]
MLETECIPRFVRALRAFPGNFTLQWRGATAIVHLAASEPLSSELGKAGAVDALVNAWKGGAAERDLRQTLLWAFGAMAALPDNQERFKAARLAALLRETI